MTTETIKTWSKNIFGRFSKVQLLSIAIIVVIVFFIGDSNIFNRLSNSLKINELNKQISYYREETQKDKEKLRELSSSNDNVEKFARENYLMRKPNEDVFIVQ